MAKGKYLSKKGPQMATACKPGAQEGIVDSELQSGLDAFAAKLHRAIQKGRSKMSEQEIAKAEKETKAILDRATSAVKSSRRTA